MSEYEDFSPDYDNDENVWVTRDGSVVRIAEMTDEHLNNAYNMCLRNVGPADLRTQKLGKEIERRQAGYSL